MDSNDICRIKCPRCESFSITRTALLTLPDEVKDYRLSAWIRQIATDGRPAPGFDSRSLKLILKGLSSYSPVEKQMILLKGLMAMTKFPGEKKLLLPILNYPLAWAANENGLNYYVKALHERGLVEKLDE